MPRSRALAALFLLLSAGAVGAYALARGGAGAASVAEALRAEPGGALAGAAGAEAADELDAEPAPPPRPRREFVPDVEVVVNIPAGRLELMLGDSLVRSYPVSVGSAAYPTPVGSFVLATVIWNPWWRPPPESDWARNRKPEPPGPANPMGRVKLHMDELIFIHGTTAEGRLGAPASHGCIRMSNPDVIDLAKRLHRYADPEVTEARLDSLSAAGREERRSVMARMVRMRVTYQVAETRGGRFHVYPDVYAQAGAEYTGRLRRELARAGVDTASLPAPAMARLRQGAARGGASFALADIPSLRPLPPEPPRERGPRLLGRPVGEVADADAAETDAPPVVAAAMETAADAEPVDEQP